MPHANGFSAWIEIDGVETTEYTTEIFDTHRTITCWIPSRVGQTFSVCWKNSYYQAHSAGHVFMDGNECGGRVLNGPSTVVAKHDGVTDGRTVRQFTFSSLKLTADDAFLTSSSHHKLGLIELSIYPAQVFGFIPPPPPGTMLSLSEIKVHERSKTSVTQQIKLAGPKTLAVPQNSVSSRLIGPPLVTFFFRYRPLDILQANGLAPPSPQLKRKPSVELHREPTPADDLEDDEEIRVLRVSKCRRLCYAY
ncbi:hypothetical protein C8R44DRAFT_763064 [Mycena epipterygia]|nr:hypothetical protein C8R44DRAFT_763064 [Mycena epipterygia]